MQFEVTFMIKFLIKNNNVQLKGTILTFLQYNALIFTLIFYILHERFETMESNQIQSINNSTLKLETHWLFFKIQI